MKSLSPLGVGGMGEVYRAKDTRLDRIVAIKIAGEHFTERFEREARAVAALNHPNICQLYDIGPNYLVMEYIDGAPVKGPLSIEESLRLAVQICDALDAAHKKGIVHRDLKPANILVARGCVKLLDFGLAKLKPSEVGESTESMPLTKENTIVGTLLYMAPEQVEGKDVDARTDIFSLGTVLYEILTGQRPFSGSSQARVIAGILKEDPPSISKSVYLSSPLLDRAVMKCLAKAPDQRWQTAADLRDELDWIREHASRPEMERPVEMARGPRRWLIAAGLAVVLLAAAAGYFLRPAPKSAVLKLSILPPEGAAFVNVSQGGAPVLSPDGKMIAFVAEKGGEQYLWVRSLNTLAPHLLAGTEDARQPFWSPDGRSIGFFAKSKLKRIDIAGGPAQILCETGLGAGGTWSRDGKILFAPSPTGNLYWIPANGGKSTPVTQLDESRNEISHVGPYFLPDGRHFLYHVRAGSLVEMSLWAAAMDGSDKKQLLTGVTRAVYAPGGLGRSGHLLFARDTTLMAQPFDSDRLLLTGDPYTVAQQVALTTGGTGGDFSVSDTGILAHRSGASLETRIEWFDRAGKNTTAVEKKEGSLRSPRLSPDGSHVAVQFYASGTRSLSDIWTHDLVRGSASRLTFSNRGAGYPVWSPDGSRVAFALPAGGLWLKSSSGTGADEELWSGAFTYPYDWSADGSLLLVNRRDPKTLWDVWLLPMTGERKAQPLLNQQFNEMESQFSPNAGGAPKWIAYTSDESGTAEVYVMAAPGNSAGKWQISNGGGGEPKWRRDGRELYFLTPDRWLMAVDISETPGFRAAAPRRLFRAPIVAGGGLAGRYDPAPDGQRFLMVTSPPETTVAGIHVVMNWQSELSK